MCTTTYQNYFSRYFNCDETFNYNCDETFHYLSTKTVILNYISQSDTFALNLLKLLTETFSELLRNEMILILK